MKVNRQMIFFFLIVTAVCILIKVLCSPIIDLSGSTGLIAVSLFSGLSIKNKKLAFLFPLLALFSTDILLQALHALNLFPYEGFYSGQILNYILFLLIVFIGIAFRNYKTAGVVASAFIGPTVFFLLSNFIVWKTQGPIMSYPNNFSGLMQCYTFGLPFYRNSLISTIIFLPAFIILYNYIMYSRFSLAHAKN